MATKKMNIEFDWTSQFGTIIIENGEPKRCLDNPINVCCEICRLCTVNYDEKTYKTCWGRN